MSKKMLHTAPKLTELLAKQSEKRSPGLFKQGVFTLQWRGKVGSFPYPDLETIVSAGEPCGQWEWKPDRDFGDLKDRLKQLPLSGYIPGSAIRGMVRGWAVKHGFKQEVENLLGYQNENQEITAGKIEFLDAWPATQEKLALDITNPQERFQVYHDKSDSGKPKPLPLYTLGNGTKPVEITIAIRGIPNLAAKNDVDTVWHWIQQALSFYGVGSRTASGYGRLKPEAQIVPVGLPEYKTQELGFSLFSQGCYGPDQDNRINVELRPSHWRGWLRSWTLRFLLGVMSERNAQLTVEELFGTLESQSGGKSRQGCVRIEMLQGTQQQPWGKKSQNSPEFYAWKGHVQISAPTKTLDSIILPIVKFAVSVGGVGRGWRRPLHQFSKEKKHGGWIQISRGTDLILTRKSEHDDRAKKFALPSEEQQWQTTYQQWTKSVQKSYPSRFLSTAQNPRAEVFSPSSCSIYLVPGPVQEPLERKAMEWSINNTAGTRGEGMALIYDSVYKRNPEVGGTAAQGKDARSYCSWVSIKCIPAKDGGTKEIVCLFMGGQTPHSDHDRSDFLYDLSEIPGAVHLFGVTPPEQN